MTQEAFFLMRFSRVCGVVPTCHRAESEMELLQ